MPTLPDPYEVLQLDPGADGATVRAAYRRLARLHHPDRGGSSLQMARLNAAYAVLRDPRLRADHDAVRREAAARAGASSGGRSGQMADPSTPVTSRATGRWSNAAGPQADGRPAAKAPPTGAFGPIFEGGPLARARARAGGGASWGEGSAGAASSEPGWAAGAAFGGLAGQGAGLGTDRVLDFGRYQGWTIAQVARTDPDFLEWLERMPVGRQYRPAIEAALGAVGRRGRAAETPTPLASTFRRAARSTSGSSRAPRLAFLHRS